MDLTAFRNAVLGSNNVTPVGPSPNAAPAVDGAIGNLQNLSRSSFQLGSSSAATDALGGAANVQGQNDAEVAAMEKKKKIDEATTMLDELMQKKKDMTDKNKYTQEIQPDGGYKFFDPTGQEISVTDYSRVVGKHTTDVLKDSQSIDDQAFVNDYDNVKKIGNILSSGDKKALDKLYEQDPELKTYLKGKTYAEVVQDFRKNYPQYFGGQSVVGVAQSGLAGGNADMSISDTRSLFQKAKDLLNPTR